MTPLLVILGPTASGKTALAAQVSLRLNGEIISADSRQVYRNMDIGTGKDLQEYEINGVRIPYHLIDIVEAGEQYNVNAFQKDFNEVYNQIVERKTIPVVCGGTGFYIHSLLMGNAFAEIPVRDDLRLSLETKDKEELLSLFETYETVYQNLADTSTRKRLIRAIEISEFLTKNPEKARQFSTISQAYEAVVFGLNPPVEIRRERISLRLKERLANGMIEEVQSLLDSGLTAEQLIYYGLEYKWITTYLTGEISRNEMEAKLETEIHRFAKRQMTFFRKMEKDGIKVHWLAPSWEKDQQIEYVMNTYHQLLPTNSI